jgi:hypothetical protein
LRTKTSAAARTPALAASRGRLSRSAYVKGLAVAARAWSAGHLARTLARARRARRTGKSGWRNRGLSSTHHLVRPAAG